MFKPDKASTAESIELCREEYRQARARYIQNNGGTQKASEYQARQQGAAAYRNALPRLSTRQNVLDFIACVADGILVDAIPDGTGSKLIYAAHAALRALPGEPKPRKIEKKHPPGAQKVNRVVSISNDGKQSELSQKM